MLRLLQEQGFFFFFFFSLANSRDLEVRLTGNLSRNCGQLLLKSQTIWRGLPPNVTLRLIILNDGLMQHCHHFGCGWLWTALDDFRRPPRIPSRDGKGSPSPTVKMVYRFFQLFCIFICKTLIIQVISFRWQ